MSKARIEKKKSAFKTVSPINIKRTSENKIKSQILLEKRERNPKRLRITALHSLQISFCSYWFQKITCLYKIKLYNWKSISNLTLPK